MKIGTNVKGEYFGEQYTGVVFESRPHTLNSGILNFVQLDNPVVIFNNPDDPRTQILVHEGGPDASKGNTIEEY